MYGDTELDYSLYVWYCIVPWEEQRGTTYQEDSKKRTISMKKDYTKRIKVVRAE